MSRHAELQLAATLRDATVSLTGTIDLLICDDDRDLVVDWKTGWAGDLPPIGEHWQMHAYAWLAHVAGRRPVTIYRVEVDQRRVQTLRFPEDVSWEACRDLLEAIAERVLEGQRETGPHCDRCPVRTACPDHLAKAGTMAMVLAPCPSFAIVSDAQAVALYASMKAVRDALKRCEEELPRYVEARGGVVEHGGQRVVMRRYEQDSITDHFHAIGRCAEIAQRPEATTSKAAIVRAAKRAGVDPDLVLADLRERGAIERVECRRLEWGK